MDDLCGKPAGALVPRLQMYFACVLQKGHKGDCKRGGDCAFCGSYIGENCPNWPTCYYGMLSDLTYFHEGFTALLASESLQTPEREFLQIVWQQHKDLRAACEAGLKVLHQTNISKKREADQMRKALYGTSEIRRVKKNADVQK